MSTSMSMTSGIVLVFWPPWATLGENVVWVSAWQVRAMPGGRSFKVPQILSEDLRASRSSSGRPNASTCASQMSSMCADGR